MVDFAMERIERGENGVILAPRGAAKSTWLNTILNAFLVATRPHIRIGLFSQKDKKAEAMSSAVRWAISESEPFRELFGDLRSPTKWTDSEWLRKGSRWAASKDRTMVTGGVNNSSAVSKRFDYLCHERGTPICDDGKWMAVEDHPSAQTVRHGDGLGVAVWGLPTAEVVTPEHRYWAIPIPDNTHHGPSTRLGPGEPRWVEAQDLQRTDAIGLPIDYAIEPPPPIPWAANLGVHRKGPDSIRSGGNDWQIVPSERPELLDPDWWWLVGLWWGDGHRTKTQIGFTVSSGVIDTRLRSVLTKYGLKAYRSERVGCWQIMSNTTNWARWLGTWRSGNAQKQPPAWVERLAPELQMALVRGYIDSDGFVDSRQREIRITSVHLPGLLALRRILARLGVPSSVRAGAGPGVATFGGREYPARQKYDLRFHDRYAQTFGLPASPTSGRYANGLNRVFIRDGFLWSKVRGVLETSDRDFIPITTRSHTYTTAFGLSHNCLDDVLDAENTYNIDRREKTEDWFWKTMKPAQAAEGVSILAIGTRWVEGDLYERLIDTNHWPALVIPAITTDAAGNDESYWPEVWPLDRLYKEREDVGWDNFACSYLNDISGSRQGVIFRREWWDPTGYFDELPRERRFLYTMGVDLASSERERADFTTRVVVAEDEQHDHWVLSAVQTKIESGHRGFVEAGAAAYPAISKIIIETNQHQSTLVQDLLNETKLPVVGRKTDTDKRTRHRAVAARYESHRVHHHRSLRGGDLENQLTGYPHGHDDLVDALYLAMDIRGVSGAIAAVSGPPRASGAATANLGDEVRFADGPALVPAYLGTLLAGVETERLTQAEAVAEANRRAEMSYIRRAMNIPGLR